jgi:hypothetical protein
MGISDRLLGKEDVYPTNTIICNDLIVCSQLCPSF